MIWPFSSIATWIYNRVVFKEYGTLPPKPAPQSVVVTKEHE